MGRYTQPDPLGLVAGVSRYAYVGNDPLQMVDPEGQTPRTGEPWSMIKLGNLERYRFFDEFGNAWFDIELPGHHCLGPAYHLWINGVRQNEIGF